MARATEQEQKGSTGASEVSGKFTRIGWGFAEITRHDNGIDLFLMVRDERRFDLGLTLGAQVKAGPSYFEKRKYDDQGELEGWWFKDSDGQHLADLAEHGLPQLLVLYNLDTQTAYWVHVTREAVQSTGKGAKILVPLANTVDEEHRRALLDIATSPRPHLQWQGSAWDGAPLLAERDVLRHAFIAPRLVAPHPNTGHGLISASQGIAMLMQARLRDLNELAGRHASVPTIEEAGASADWTWRLFGALGQRLVAGEIDALRAAADGAPDPAARTAATVTAVAGLMEEGRPDEAVVMLEEARELDDATPIDHAWLTAHYARALAEIGRLPEAREAAASIQGLRWSHPDDVTAAAIEGVAAKLLFRITDFGSGDLEEAIRGSDTAVTWWRQQAIAHALSDVLERSFQGWARDQTTRWSASDIANDQLLATALNANITGDHGDWRYICSLLGQDQLLRLNRDSHPAAVNAGLTTLRLAGAEDALKLATEWVVRDGPALGARSAAAAVRLDSSTRTTARTNLDLLRYAGPVLDEETADQAIQWIIGTLADLSTFRTRVAPTFEVPSRLLDTLARVLRGASVASHVLVVDYLLSQPAIKNPIWASSWAGVVRQLDKSAWTPDKARRAYERGKHDDEGLNHALRRVAAAHHNDIRQNLLDEIRAGSIDALGAFGDIRDLTPDAVTACLTVAGDGLRRIVSNAQKGHFDGGGLDQGETVTLLNIWHPDQADWEPLITMLADPLVSGEDKILSVSHLAGHSDQIPDSLHATLTGIAAELVQRPPTGFASLMGKPTDVAGPAALLQAKLGTDTQTLSHLMITLAAGDADRRAWAARLAGQRANPEDVGLLTALARDREPNVRAAAAAALTMYVAAHPGDPLAENALLCGLKDPGFVVPDAVAAILAKTTESNPIIDAARQELGRHPLRPIRRAIEGGTE